MDHLEVLESQGIYILREAYRSFKNLVMLWSIGKDSTVLLWLARKAFFGHVPFPLMHIDTCYKMPEMIEYRNKFALQWKLNLIVGKNEAALKMTLDHLELFPYDRIYLLPIVDSEIAKDGGTRSLDKKFQLEMDQKIREFLQEYNIEHQELPLPKEEDNFRNIWKKIIVNQTLKDLNQPEKYIIK